jgi:NTE family protein
MGRVKRKVTYGLALSGGGARGIAHLGVLAALEQNDYRPSVLSGTSMGALVAVGYGLGIPVEEMLRLIKKEIKPIHISNIDRRRLGIFHLHKVEQLFRSLAVRDNFDVLKVPTFLSVTNLNSGQNEIKSEGKLIDFAIASASIPLLFRPVIINDVYYVDGGLTKNMAAEVLKDKCDKLIGVHVNHIAQKEEFRRMKDIAARAYHLAIFNTIRNELGYCDYIVDPPGTRQYTTLDFHKADEIFDVGYQEGLLLVKMLQNDEKQNARPFIPPLKSSYRKISKIIRPF